MASPAAVRREGDTVFINGSITDATLNQFNRALDANVRAVVVHSGGGDSLAAVAIGRQIYLRGLKVVVDGACMSACAHFIFLPAKARVVNSDSLVVFHNTSTSIHRMLKGTVDPSAEAFLAPRVQAERDLFREAKISETWLVQPQLMLVTHCYTYFRDGSGKVVDVKFKANFNGWVPSVELLRKLGIAVVGFWPTTQDDFLRAFNKVFAPGGPMRALWGGSNLISQSEIVEGFERIADCTPVASGITGSGTKSGK